MLQKEEKEKVLQERTWQHHIENEYFMLKSSTSIFDEDYERKKQTRLIKLVQTLSGYM